MRPCLSKTKGRGNEWGRKKEGEQEEEEEEEDGGLLTKIIDLPVTICLLLEHFIIITTGMARLQYRHSKYNPESLKCYQTSLLLHHPGHC